MPKKNACGSWVAIGLLVLPSLISCFPSGQLSSVTLINNHDYNIFVRVANEPVLVKARSRATVRAFMGGKNAFYVHVRREGADRERRVLIEEKDIVMRGSSYEITVQESSKDGREFEVVE